LIIIWYLADVTVRNLLISVYVDNQFTEGLKKNFSVYIFNLTDSDKRVT